MEYAYRKNDAFLVIGEESYYIAMARLFDVSIKQKTSQVQLGFHGVVQATHVDGNKFVWKAELYSVSAELEFRKYLFNLNHVYVHRLKLFCPIENKRALIFEHCVPLSTSRFNGECTICGEVFPDENGNIYSRLDYVPTLQASGLLSLNTGPDMWDPTATAQENQTQKFYPPKGGWPQLDAPAKEPEKIKPKQEILLNVKREVDLDDD